MYQSKRIYNKKATLWNPNLLQVLERVWISIQQTFQVWRKILSVYQPNICGRGRMLISEEIFYHTPVNYNWYYWPIQICWNKLLQIREMKFDCFQIYGKSNESKEMFWIYSSIRWRIQYVSCCLYLRQFRQQMWRITWSYCSEVSDV